MNPTNLSHTIFSVDDIRNLMEAELRAVRARGVYNPEIVPPDLWECRGEAEEISQLPPSQNRQQINIPTGGLIWGRGGRGKISSEERLAILSQVEEKQH